MSRTQVRYYSWCWDELPTAEGAAFAEERTLADDGTLLERRRVALENTARTVSTDPRAGAIMAEELGLRQAARPMGGPHW